MLSKLEQSNSWKNFKICRIFFQKLFDLGIKTFTGDDTSIQRKNILSYIEISNGERHQR